MEYQARLSSDGCRRRSGDLGIDFLGEIKNALLVGVNS